MRSSLIIGALGLTVFTASCVSRTQYMSQVNAARGLTDTLNKLRPYLDQLEQENKSLRGENAGLKKTAADAAWVSAQRQKLKKLVEALEAQGGGTSIKGVQAVPGPGGSVGLRIDDTVLFRAGSVEISEEGRGTLGRLVPILTKEDRVIRVDGHTDADPISKSKWKSNLHLSAQRALAVAEVLQGFGVPYDKLLIAGKGPTDPATKAPGEKARNRRVELFLQ